MQSQLVRSISRIFNKTRTEVASVTCLNRRQAVKARCSTLFFCKQFSTSVNLNKDANYSSSASFQQQPTQSKNKPLYPGHIPTSTVQKGLLALGSALVSLINPLRTDMVAALGETTGPIALRHLYEKMLDHPVGRQILAEKPHITPETLPLDKLLQYPPGTLGREYADFMSSHSFGSDNRPAVRFVDDPELAYVMARYRQVHDFWHVLSGLETDVFGEIALKWFEFMQTGLPMAALSTIAFPFKLTLKEQAILTRIYLPWAVECSKSCIFLMNVYYEKILDRNVVELREEFGFVKPPRQSSAQM